MQEGLAKRIELPEDNPLLISQLICYCYTTDYKFVRHTDNATETEDAFDFPPYFHAAMYAMAEKFDLKNLKKLAEKKFGTALYVLDAIFPIEASGNEPFSLILEVIRLIYRTTPENDRGLRDLVFRFLARNWDAFLAQQEFKTFIMAANMDFVMGIIAASKEEGSSLGSYNGLR